MSALDLSFIPLIPLVGAFAILLAARLGPNLRELATLVTAALLALSVWSHLPGLMNGERPEQALIEVMPGLELAFRLEPLGMLFAALASLLWIINSIRTAYTTIGWIVVIFHHGNQGASYSDA